MRRIIALMIFVCCGLSTSVCAAESDSADVFDKVDAPVVKDLSHDETHKALSMEEIKTLAGDPFKDEFDWLPVTDSDWTASVSASLGDAGAFWLFEHTAATDGKIRSHKTVQRYERIRIVNAEGQEHADRKLYFLEGFFDSLQIRGRTILRDGRTIELDTTRIVHEDMRLSSDLNRRIVSFSLPGVSDDCILDIYLRYKDMSGSGAWYYQHEAPALSCTYYWYPARNSARMLSSEALSGLGLPEKFLKKFDTYVTKVGRDWRPSIYIWQNAQGEINTQTIPETTPRVLVFTAKNVPAIEIEPLSLPENMQQSRLVTYRSKNQNSDLFWKGVVSGMKYGQGKFAQKSKRIIKAASKIRKNFKKEERIEAAYDWLQKEVINIENIDWFSERDRVKKIKRKIDKKLKKWRKRKSQKPERMDDVLKSKSATGTQINLLFAELLRRLNIPAQLVWVVDRDSSLFSPNLRYWQFHHAVVVTRDSLGAPRGYDPSIPYLAPGQLRWQHEGIRGIALGDVEDVFINTPSSKKSENRIVRSIEIDKLDEAGWHARLFERLSGQPAIGLREALWPHDSASHKTEIIRGFEITHQGVVVDSVAVNGLWNPRKPLSVEYFISGQHSLTSTGERLFVTLKDILGDHPNPFTADIRRQPIVFGFPYTLTETASFHLDSSWVLEAVPEGENHSCSAGSSQLTIKVLGETVSAQRLFSINKPYVGRELYAEVRQLFNARKALGDIALALKRE